jgi:hypothetical protein
VPANRLAALVRYGLAAKAPALGDRRRPRPASPVPEADYRQQPRDITN